MDGFAVAAIEPGNIGPDILDTDREQNPAGFDRRSGVETHLEQLTGLVRRVIDDAVHELNGEFLAFRSSKRAKLRGPNALVAEVAVDTAGFPVPRIAGIDNHDFVEVASEPECSAEAGRAAAYNGNIISLRSHARRGCKKKSGFRIAFDSNVQQTAKRLSGWS